MSKVRIALLFTLLCLLAGCADRQARQRATPTARARPAATAATIPMLGRTPTPAGSRTEPLVCGDNQDQAGVGDPYYPRLGNGGYDTRRYDIDLRVEMPDAPDDELAGTIDAVVTIDARATQELSSFDLDLTGFEISSVTVDDANADFSRRQGELTITPETAIKSGADFTVAIAYNGTPNSVESLGDLVGWIWVEDGAYVFSEPDGAHLWFPSNDHPCDKATYTTRVDVAQPYVVAGNGTLTGSEQADGRGVYTWDSSDPMASYLVTLVIGEYELHTDQGPDGLPIRNYYPPDWVQESEEIFGDTAEMIELFEEQFGPYPFEAYGVAVVVGGGETALETQTLSLYGDIIFDDPDEAQLVAAHELAHQWFGDSVSLENWRDVWLKEGPATYAEWLWLEHLYGEDALNQTISIMYDYVAGEQPPPPGNPPQDDLYNTGVYLRGGLTMHALRTLLGDDDFFAILRTFTTRYENSNAGTDEFIALAEEISGEGLDDFFDRWLYQERLPSQSELES